MRRPSAHGLRAPAFGRRGRPAGAGGALSCVALWLRWGGRVVARGVGATQLVCLKHLDGAFGVLSPGGLTPAAMLDYRRDRGVSNGTLRRELNVLVAALGWAVRHKVIASAPVVELPPAGSARSVFLPEGVEADLWSLASQDLSFGRLSRIGRFICLGLETGARRAAIEGLTWDRVDLVRRVIDFRDPGVRVTKKRRVATPISTRSLPVLQRAAAERRPGGGAWVLDNNGDIKKTWATFMAKHGFKDVTPHVLRHTRITLLLRAGVTVWDVSALVGATPDVIHEVYGHHVADERLRQQADRRLGA
jgi:integrase